MAVNKGDCSLVKIKFSYHSGSSKDYVVLLHHQFKRARVVYCVVVLLW